MADDKALRKARAKLDKALEANRNEEAIKLLAELIAHEPANARWPHKRGDLLRRVGRNAEAVVCYASAVEIYAESGFIARAVAMAKTVLNLDPARIDILERVDPTAAQQLRSPQRPAAAPAQSPAPPRAAPKRHPMLLDDDAPPVAKPSPAAQPPAAAAAQRPPMSRDGPPPAAARVGPPPVPARAVQPRIGIAPPPPPPVPNPRASPLTLDKLSLPPTAAAKPPARSARLDAAEIYSQALDRVNELCVDPAAEPNETRFSDAPQHAAVEVDLSEVELEPRARVPSLESLQPDPPPASRLAKLPLFPLFAEVPKDALAQMIASSELIELEHGAYVMRKGDPGDGLYGIIEGSVDVVVPGQQFSVTMAEGDVFGEACLLEDEKCPADARVEGKLVALRVPRETLIELLEAHPPLVELLLELLTRRLLGNLLQTSPLFQEFDAAGRRELARLFEVRRAPAGTMLSMVGKKMDGLYISLTGTLAIHQPGAPERSGPPGSMFGQNTLLSNAASQVDVQARVNMVLLRLPTAQFSRVAMQYPTMLERLSEYSTSEVVKVTV
jgi:cAMP-dependent protein kinase regulator